VQSYWSTSRPSRQPYGDRVPTTTAKIRASELRAGDRIYLLPTWTEPVELTDVRPSRMDRRYVEIRSPGLRFGHTLLGQDEIVRIAPRD
jgi:hypothetical protein